MNTLIVYATKYGSTKLCAELLAKSLPNGADLINLAEEARPNLHHYNTIVVGSPIYEDRLHPKIQHFCKKNKGILMSGIFACFLCHSSLSSETQALFTRNFDTELLQHALAHSGFGGEVQWDKLSYKDRLLYGKETYAQAKKQNLMIRPDKIDSFALALELKDRNYHLQEN